MMRYSASSITPSNQFDLPSPTMSATMSTLTNRQMVSKFCCS